MHKLFVYGTLRRPVGGPPGDTLYHERISGGIIDAHHATLGNARLIDCGSFPGIGAGDGVVRGEVFSVTEETLQIADGIEGHPDFYERRRESVTLDDGSVVDAWVYWAPDSLLDATGARLISSGDWFDRDRNVEFPEPLELPDDPVVRRAFDRLTSETLSWFASVRPNGRPHSTPMWHAVVGNRIYVVTHATASKVENVAREPHVVVTLPDAQDVVIVDGWAIEANHLLDLLAPAFIERYDWDPREHEKRGSGPAVIEVTPQVLRTWTGEDNHRRFTLT